MVEHRDQWVALTLSVCTPANTRFSDATGDPARRRVRGGGSRSRLKVIA